LRSRGPPRPPSTPRRATTPARRRSRSPTPPPTPPSSTPPTEPPPQPRQRPSRALSRSPPPRPSRPSPPHPTSLKAPSLLQPTPSALSPRAKACGPGWAAARSPACPPSTEPSGSRIRRTPQAAIPADSSFPVPAALCSSSAVATAATPSTATRCGSTTRRPPNGHGSPAPATSTPREITAPWECPPRPISRPHAILQRAGPIGQESFTSSAAARTTAACPRNSTTSGPTTLPLPPSPGSAAATLPARMARPAPSVSLPPPTSQAPGRTPVPAPINRDISGCSGAQVPLHPSEISGI
jgi:hypothetical protein